MTLKEIKSKINSTKRISQITGALQLVSAVKMKKAQNIALKSRLFSQKVVEILKRLSEYQKQHPEKKFFYFQPRETKKVLAVVVSSDKGFCSAFNKNILRFADKQINEMSNDVSVDVMPVGKKAIAFFKKKEFDFKISFTGIGDYAEFEEIKPLSDLFLKYFEENKYQKIYIFYTDFISSFIQKPKKMQILPLDTEALEEMLKRDGLKKKDLEESNTGKDKNEKNVDYVFEPSPEKIFESLVPRLIEYEIYHAILEANASEHSARMVAMKNASQNAEEIIEELVLSYNKIRQNKITSEVGEISSAKEAMA